MIELRPGDIVAEKGKGFVGWIARNALVPRCDRFHFFLIDSFVPWEDDYRILESISSKGVTVGRLAWYNVDDLEFYRVNDAAWEELGRRAVAELTKRGRCRYDYLLPLKLVMSALRLVVTGQLPPWRPSQLAYVRDSHLLCLEAVNEAYRSLLPEPIIPRGVCPLPAGFQEALDQQRLIRVYPTSP